MNQMRFQSAKKSPLANTDLSQNQNYSPTGMMFQSAKKSPLANTGYFDMINIITSAAMGTPIVSIG